MSGAIDIPVVSKFDPTGIKQAQGALGGFGKAVAGIGAAIASAFAIRAVANFAMETIRMAEEAQQANAVLKQVAKTTGQFGSELDSVTNRLIKFADAQELRLGVDAELIKQVQAQLLSFKALGQSAGQVGGSFDRATKAAFDMAMVLKSDASSQAIALGKALEDPIRGITALRRGGTTFTEQQQEQIRVLVESNRLLDAQALILNEVESQYGGAAEAGALWSERLRLAFDQVKEQVGIALTPAFEAFATYFINNWVPVLTKFFETDFPEFLVDFKEAFKQLTPAFEAVEDALKEALKIPDDVSLLEGLLKTLSELPENKTFRDFTQSIIDLTPSLLELIPVLTELLEELLPLALLILPFLTDFVRGLIPVFGEDGLAGAIKEATTRFEEWQDPANWFSDSAERLGALVEGFARPWVIVSAAINGAYDALMRWLGLSGTPNPTVNLRPGQRLPASRRAAGGRVTGGSPYLVGEVGPELFVPGRGGMVIPNDRLGAGGGANITINVNAGLGTNGAQVGEQIVNAIRRYERTSGPVFARA